MLLARRHMQTVRLGMMVVLCAAALCRAALPSRFSIDNSAPLLHLISFPGAVDYMDIGERLMVKDRQLFEEIYRQTKDNIIRALKTIEQEQLAELRNNTLSVMPTEKEIEEFIENNSMVNDLAAAPKPPTGEELLRLATPNPAAKPPPKAPPKTALKAAPKKTK